MSRGIKDLREIICLSRLSARESSEDDTDDTRPSSTEDGLSSGRQSATILSASSKDSGCYASQNKSPLLTGKRTSLIISSPIISQSKEPNNNSSEDGLAPLPSSSSLDYIMPYLDSEIVKDWLSRANETVSRLTKWFAKEENFIDFAHFWLSEFELEQKCEILHLEHSVLLDELQLGFHTGILSKRIQIDDLNLVLDAVLHEYPSKWLTKRVNYSLLNYLEVITSGKSDEYRKLLTWVKLTTKNRTYTQWFLSIRSFGLINMLSAVVNFYTQLFQRGAIRSLSQQTGLHYFDSSGWDKWKKRTLLVISGSSICCLKYFIDEKKINPVTFCDATGKNLVSLSVSIQKPQILKYLLLKKELGSLDLNQTAENGSSPLHTAVTLNNFSCVQLLVENGRVNINSRNSLSGNVTPLHVAVLCSSKEIVKYLVQHGAALNAKNDDGFTPCELASALGMEEIEQFLNKL